MSLGEFIEQVLLEINTGLSKASDYADRNYYVDTTQSKGVDFDIAVTTVTSTSAEASAQAKAGVIQVLGIGIGGKAEGKIENSEVSRIKFTVYVPWKSKTQELQDNFGGR